MSNRITLVFGTRGGIGTTAWAIDACPVGGALVDLDLVHGDLARRVGVRPQAHIATLVAAGAALDAEAVAVVAHRCSGGRLVVPSPASIELAEVVTPDLVTGVVTGLASRTDVFVDAGSSPRASVFELLDHVSDVIVVTGRRTSDRERADALVDLVLRAGGPTARVVCAPSAPARMARSVGRAVWAAIGARRIGNVPEVVGVGSHP